ncbi:hypothetical protein MYX06_02230 [Patescibacteria group bacterium AH-259-L05]|nr:hypothetical protein [Patescibacteria group bacterium AH-259-L05]
MEQFKKEQSREKRQSILEDEDVKDFIKMRNIRPEDFEIIEKLYTYPQEFFIEYHNLYSFEGEKTAQQLDRIIQDLREQIRDAEQKKYDPLRSVPKLKEKIEVTMLLLSVVAKYDWHTARHLNSLLERKAKYQAYLQKQYYEKEDSE